MPRRAERGTRTVTGEPEATRASPEIGIRSARREDLAAVLDIWARSRSDAPDVPDDQDGLLALLDRDAESLLVAEERGAIVATLIAGWDGWRGNMYRLTVVPSRRRKGIAMKLVRAAEERLRARGARRITALVAREDDPAVAVWTAAGYARDAGVARFVRNL